MKTKALTVLAALDLLFSGAAELAAQSGNPPIPAYSETDLAQKAALVFPGMGRMALKTTDDGLLVLVDYTKDWRGRLLKLLDSIGTKVKEIPLNVVGNAMGLRIDPNGNICVLMNAEIQWKRVYMRQVIVFSPEGKKIRSTILG